MNKQTTEFIVPDYNEYAQRIVKAIDLYGEKINIKYRTTEYDPVRGEIYSYKKLKNYKAFIRPTDQTDWTQLPDGLRIKDVRKMYFTKELPKKELIVERIQDGKEYEIVVPPVDNYFEGKCFYYKCFIAVKEVENDAD